MSEANSKFTPGPWKRERRSATEAVLTVDGEIIGEVYGHSAGDAQKAIANASLITAAPDLLAACKEMLYQWWGGDEATEISKEAFRRNSPDHPVNKWEAAIARAESGAA